MLTAGRTHFARTKIFSEMFVRYGALEENEEEINTNADSISDSLTVCCHYKSILLGVVLSVISGALFTENNFVIKQFDVVVSDAVLVRCVIQITIFTFIIFYTGDNILPEDKRKRLYTLAQGAIL